MTPTPVAPGITRTHRQPPIKTDAQLVADACRSVARIKISNSLGYGRSGHPTQLRLEDEAARLFALADKHDGALCTDG